MSFTLAASILVANIEKAIFFPSIILYFTTGILSFFIMHVSQYVWIKYLSKLGYFRKNVLIIGNPDIRFPIDSYFQDIGNTRDYIGRVKYTGNTWIWQSADKQENIIKDAEDINNIILKKNVGEIIFFIGEKLQQDLLLNIVYFCQMVHISYYIVPDIKQLPVKHPWNNIFPYIPVLERYSTRRDSLTSISLKRFIDIIISFFSLIIFLPIGIIIFFAIKHEDGGPIFYITTRIGKNGKPIKFFKFRTMNVNADKEKHKLLKFNTRKNGPLFKMQDDPRMTKVGIILRRYSLDEIPQMINVLIGNMSLTGPRPHLPEEVSEYKDGDYLRLECMPGIVGLPQITGRNTLGFREWVDLDLKYRKNWTLSLDFRIMLKTLKIIVTSMLTKSEYSGY